MSVAIPAALLLAALSGVLTAQGPGPGAPCEPCAGKRCVAVPDVKKTTRAVYACKSVDVCAARCHCDLFARLFGGCGDSCGRVREKRSLIKFTETCERPAVKCVVEGKASSACGPLAPPH